MKALENINDILKNEIDRFDKESNKHKNIYRNTQVGIIVLMTCTTIAAGAGLVLTNMQSHMVQFVVLCLTASTTALTGWAEMRRARELWQHEREVFYALVDIRREIQFLSSHRILSDDDLVEYFQRISAVLSSSSQKWARIQEKKEGQNVLPHGLRNDK